MNSQLDILDLYNTFPLILTSLYSLSVSLLRHNYHSVRTHSCYPYVDCWVERRQRSGRIPDERAGACRLLLHSVSFCYEIPIGIQDPCYFATCSYWSSLISGHTASFQFPDLRATRTDVPQRISPSFCVREVETPMAFNPSNIKSLIDFQIEVLLSP
jgi:hypothetical protein